MKAAYYSPSLDGLRFMAALMVFYHHAAPLPFFWRIRSYGWVGVDLFLVLSAFLLTRLLSLEYQQHGTLRIRDFFVRRVLRIWPLYLGYATAICVTSAIWFGQDASTAFGWWLSHMTLTNNVLTAFEGFSPIRFSAHLWTIPLEVQAYILLPFVLLAIFRKKLDRHRIIVAAGLALSVLIFLRFSLFLQGVSFPFTYVLPLRADAFALGVAVALLTSGDSLRHPVLAMVAGVLLMGSIMLLPSIYTHGLHQVIVYTLTAAGSVLIIVASQARVFRESVLSAAPMRYLGKISFGIYVYHLACIKVAEIALASLGIGFEVWQFLGGLGLTVLVAGLSYQYFEKPFLRLKTRYTTVSSRPL